MSKHTLSLAFLVALSPPALFLAGSIAAVVVGGTLACGDSSEGTTGTSTGAGECLPSGPALPFGPCGPGCSGDICVDPIGDGDVCAVACSSEADCDAGVTCTPDGAAPACVLGWCVIPCSAASAACPEGMTCDVPTNICVWPTEAA